MSSVEPTATPTPKSPPLANILPTVNPFRQLSESENFPPFLEAIQEYNDDDDDASFYHDDDDDDDDETNMVANLSIGAQAALNEHARHVAKFGLDDDFSSKYDAETIKKEDDANNGGASQAASPSRRLDEEWDRLLDGSFSHVSLSSSLLLSEQVPRLLSNMKESSPSQSHLEGAPLDLDQDDKNGSSYFDSSRVWALETPERLRKSNDESACFELRGMVTGRGADTEEIPFMPTCCTSLETTSPCTKKDSDHTATSLTPPQSNVSFTLQPSPPPLSPLAVTTASEANQGLLSPFKAVDLSQISGTADSQTGSPSECATTSTTRAPSIALLFDGHNDNIECVEEEEPLQELGVLSPLKEKVMEDHHDLVAWLTGIMDEGSMDEIEVKDISQASLPKLDLSNVFEETGPSSKKENLFHESGSDQNDDDSCSKSNAIGAENQDEDQLVGQQELDETRGVVSEVESNSNTVESKPDDVETNQTPCGDKSEHELQQHAAHSDTSSNSSHSSDHKEEQVQDASAAVSVEDGDSNPALDISLDSDTGAETPTFELHCSPMVVKAADVASRFVVMKRQIDVLKNRLETAKEMEHATTQIYSPQKHETTSNTVTPEKPLCGTSHKVTPDKPVDTTAVSTPSPRSCTKQNRSPMISPKQKAIAVASSSAVSPKSMANTLSSGSSCSLTVRSRRAAVLHKASLKNNKPLSPVANDEKPAIVQDEKAKEDHTPSSLIVDEKSKEDERPTAIQDEKSKENTQPMPDTSSELQSTSLKGQARGSNGRLTMAPSTLPGLCPIDENRSTTYEVPPSSIVPEIPKRPVVYAPCHPTPVVHVDSQRVPIPSHDTRVQVKPPIERRRFRTVVPVRVYLDSPCDYYAGDDSFSNPLPHQELSYAQLYAEATERATNSRHLPRRQMLV